MSEITHLLIDADDTLWENNIYFERATRLFVDHLAHSTLTHDEVVAILEDFERVNVPIYGYGSAVYARSLEEAFRSLVERSISDEDIETVVALGKSVFEGDFELIPNVETTLASLRARYALVMCTKGQYDEQMIKVDRSGLASYFMQIEVMREKDEATYAEILARLGIVPAQACMIGNSPKSDILPPLALGMRAIFVPHDHTWQLEHQEIDVDDSWVDGCGAIRRSGDSSLTTC